MKNSHLIDKIKMLFWISYSFPSPSQENAAFKKHNTQEMFQVDLLKLKL